jgi:hypothetical protein
MSCIHVYIEIEPGKNGSTVYVAPHCDGVYNSCGFVSLVGYSRGIFMLDADDFTLGRVLHMNIILCALPFGSVRESPLRLDFPTETLFRSL